MMTGKLLRNPIKKILVLLFIVIASCSSPEGDVRTYLKETAPQLSSLEIMEVEVDSTYSPIIDLQRAQRMCSEIKNTITKAWADTDETTSYKVVTRVEDSLSGKFDTIQDIAFNAEMVLNSKNLNLGDHNTTGVLAKYRINGQLRTDWFYYGINGIYNSTIDVEREYNYLMEDMIDLENDISFKKRN